jgi:hypothetical protein
MSNTFLEILDDGVIEIEMEEVDDPTWVELPRFQYDDDPTPPYAGRGLMRLCDSQEETSTNRWC